MMVARAAITAFAAALTALALLATPATAQTQPGTPQPLAAQQSEPPADFNPLKILSDAAEMLPGAGDGFPAAQSQFNAPPRNSDSSGGLSVALNIMLLLTVIALVPSIMLMCTCFVRIIIVLGLLRQAMGTQSLPPGQVVTGLALFLTALVMSPTIERVWNEAVVPYQQGEVRDYEDLWARGVQPMRDFMFDQIEATDNWSSLYLVLNYRGVDTTRPDQLTRADVPTFTLIPAYMLSELKTAFLMGFRVYLPFLVIDMVIASLLISMSMMMLPPVLISVPFKLLLFVLVDGWTLVVGSLLESFVADGGPAQSAHTAMLLLIPVCVIHRAVKDDGGICAHTRGLCAHRGKEARPCRSTKPRSNSSATR